MKQSKRFRVIGGATAIAAIALAGVGVSLSEKAGIRVLGDAPSYSISFAEGSNTLGIGSGSGTSIALTPAGVSIHFAYSGLIQATEGPISFPSSLKSRIRIRIVWEVFSIAENQKEQLQRRFDEKGSGA